MRASFRPGSRRMTRMKTLACMRLLFVGVAPVAADTTTNSDAPKSLRMRMRDAKRVAQAPQPSGDQPQPTPDSANPPTPAEPAPPAPADATPPAPAPVSSTPNLSDDELKKLSEQ